MNQSSDPVRLEPADPVRGLIPWFVNGTLTADERNALAAAINSDLRCRADYQFWTAVAAAVRDDRPEERATEQRLAALLDRIDALDRAGAGRGGRYRTLLRPLAGLRRAAPLLVILTTIALAFGHMHRSVTPRWHTAGTVQQAAAGELRLVFAPGLTQDAIADLRREYALEFVAGPSPAGVYRARSGAPAEALARLRTDRRIRFVEGPPERAR